MVRLVVTPGSSYQEKIRYLAHIEDNPRLEKQVIWKVPLMLRNREKLVRHFEPRGVSLGPIHYGQPNLEPAEELKVKLATDFIKHSGCTVEELYGLVEANIEELALCYSEEVNDLFPLTQLAWILFIDGCAVLHFIYHVVHPHHQIFKRLNIKNLAVFAQEDVLLLENQLPFKVLDLLMSNNLKGETLKKAIVRFVGMNVSVTPKSDKDVPLNPPPHHLLDLLRRALLMGGEKLTIVRVEEEEEEEEWPMFYNVQELQTTGIYVKRCETRKGLDVEFKHGLWGTLVIPGIIVDHSTQPKLLNLVAYEMCPEFLNDFEVTSYICLLDSLINQAEDVKELRKESVILNLLGSDEQLANIFNVIAMDLVTNSEIYSEVKKEIEEHINTSYKTLLFWMTEAYYNYFSSPWSILAFLGAIMGLVLTFVQTWYAPRSDPPCICKLS